jgi:hypothetical protein
MPQNVLKDNVNKMIQSQEGMFYVRKWPVNDKEKMFPVRKKFENTCHQTIFMIVIFFSTFNCLLKPERVIKLKLALSLLSGKTVFKSPKQLKNFWNSLRIMFNKWVCMNNAIFERSVPCQHLLGLTKVYISCFCTSITFDAWHLWALK